MARFYFHVRSNGVLAEGGRGLNCKDARAACAFAVKKMPLYLRAGLKETSTHVSTQICDDQDETIAVVRGTVTIERWRAASFTALSPRFQSSPLRSITPADDDERSHAPAAAVDHRSDRPE